ncbi:hypothetical protein EDB80DRAFT_430302 [Ilyonectria destructans]|nr:hypothetical protein EDB80DRAFT_430302 [Ilyonectria destructans]
MDPLSIVASVIAVIGVLKGAYKTLDNIKDLPKAFSEVKKNLPLVRKILQDVRDKLEDSEVLIPDDERESVLAILQPCDKSATILKRIFGELEERCRKDQAEKNWTKMRAWYCTALRRTKANRVESLMNEIMSGVQKLGWNEIFNLSKSQDMEDLKRAIKDLSEVEPSLEDSEFDNMGVINAEQHVASNASAQQYFAQGGTNSYYSGTYNITGTSATVNIGKES